MCVASRCVVGEQTLKATPPTQVYNLRGLNIKNLQKQTLRTTQAMLCSPLCPGFSFKEINTQNGRVHRSTFSPPLCFSAMNKRFALGIFADTGRVGNQCTFWFPVCSSSSRDSCYSVGSVRDVEDPVCRSKACDSNGELSGTT